MGEASYTHFTHLVDAFYFSALHGEDELFPISDEKYAGELQFQEVLMSSIIANSSSSSSQRRHAPLQLRLHRSTATVPMNITKTTTTGTSSSSRRTLCEICADAKPWGEMFRNQSCFHVFCNDCVSQHIAAKVQENITRVKCPEVECGGVLEPEMCRDIIPEEVFERWGRALCESMVLGSPSDQIFYCPFKDCSAFLVNDDDKDAVVGESECPQCHRLFCVQCKVAWHAGLGCQEYQQRLLRKGGEANYDRGRKEDLMMMDLAKNKNWKRCPNCKFYVEKTQGCLHITCRCGFQFCYGCGQTWSVIHACCHT